MRAMAAATLALAAIPVAALAHLDDSGVNWSRIDLPAERAAIERYQSFDQRLQDVGWKMVRGNVRFCDRRILSIGLQLQDLKSYGGPEVARRALGLTGDFAVQTAARGSPAEETGLFAKNREIARLDSFDPNEWVAGDRLYWQRLTLAHDHIDETLIQRGAITIEFAGGESVKLAPVEVCASRFELMGEGRKAVADGDRVVIGIDFPAFEYSEELFAAVVAHELAHNLLAHSNWLDRNGRNRRNTRMIEREADRLMPWLMANAGYDPQAAVQFFEELRPASGSVLFIRGTHPSWRERVASVEAEIPLVSELIARDGSADWRVHFEREIDPNQGL
ncbi:MAG: M48 family metalloprotease [Pseudomonadota bacterium]